MEIVIKGTAKEMADLLREVTSLPDEKKHTLPSDEIPVHSHVVEDKRYQDLCREHLLNSIKNGTDPLIGFPEKKNSNISSHMHCASIWHDPDFRSKFPNGAPISDGSEGTLIGRVPGKMRIEIDNIDDASKPEIHTEASKKKGKLRVVVENVDTSSIPTYRETAVDE